MKDDEPITIARSLFEAIRRKRWKRAASLLHPDTRELVRKAVTHRIDNDPNARLTVDMLRRNDPDMPIECAEYQLRRAREHHARNPWNRVSMGVTTRNSCARWTPSN